MTPAQAVNEKRDPAPLIGVALLVASEAEERRAFASALRGEGWRLLVASGRSEALQMLGSAAIQVVCAKEDGSGRSVDLLREIRERWPTVRRILVSERLQPELLMRAVNEAEVSRVLRSVTDVSLRASLDGALERCEASRSLREHARDLEAEVCFQARDMENAKRAWEMTFDALRMPIAIIGTGHVLKRANRACAELRGEDIRRVTGRPCHVVMFGLGAPCEHCPARTVLAGAPKACAEIEVRERHYRVSAFNGPDAGSAICSYQDVTEDKRAVASAMQTEKMVALGQLAGGVAHEINNPIASILAFAQLMRGDHGRSGEDDQTLQMIEASAVRCKRIVESMLRFSRRDQQRAQLDLLGCIQEAVLLFQLQVKNQPRAKMAIEAPEGMLMITANGSQLQQVVLNLLQNALQALPGGEGTVTLRVAEKDGEAVIEVADTGVGIRPEHLPRIFEPTFTTKPPGQGTGFGLAITDAIVREHGGRIEVATQLGSGTTFTVRLPIT